MDPATTALLVSTLAGLLTAWQEWRHRKIVKDIKAGASMAEAFKAKPVPK